MRNTGKTPALKVAWVCCIFVTGSVLGPFPDFDSVTADWKEKAKARIREHEKQMEPFLKLHPEMRESMKKWDEEMEQKMMAAYDHTQVQSGGVVAPDAAINILLSGPINISKANVFPPPPPVAQFILGKVTYDDVFHERRHTTKFCVMETESGLGLCPEGNWMD
jgi:hypothetical protein